MAGSGQTYKFHLNCLEHSVCISLNKPSKFFIYFGLYFNRYDSFNIKNDIALIKLKNPVDFTKGSVGAVCLPNEYNGSGKIESLLTQPTIIGT